MIRFVARDLTGSGHVRAVQVAERMGYTYGLINDLPPRDTKILVVVQRVLPDYIAPGTIVVADVIDHDTPIIDTVDAVIVPSEHAKSLLKGRNSNIFVIPCHHMNTENYVVAENRDVLGTMGYVGPLKWFKGPESVMNINPKTNSGIEDVLYPFLDKVDVMWNYRIDSIDVNFKTAAKSKNSMSWGIPSINAMEPATIELTPRGCIICSYEDAEGYFIELRSNRKYYNEIREEGLREAKQYHIDEIVKKYQSMFKELLT